MSDLHDMSWSELVELAKKHRDRIEELEAHVEALQNKCANRGLSPEDSDALEAENEKLRGVYEAAKYARSAKVMTNTHLQKLDKALYALQETDDER